jgi:hypothetical protein
MARRSGVTLIRPPWLRAGVTVTGRPASPSVSSYTGRIRGVTLTGGQNQATATSGGTASTQAGPQGLGTVWYPAQVTVSTTTGITTGADTSICNLYLGAAGFPSTLLGTIFGGNGLLGVALPPLTVGLFVIAQWTGAHPGDACALNVQGTMDALAMS